MTPGGVPDNVCCLCGYVTAFAITWLAINSNARQEGRLYKGRSLK